MTYDELLDKIYWHWRKDDRGDGLKPMTDYRRVILAVVELHKPSNMGFDWLSKDLCNVCLQEQGDYMSPISVRYPCPTIQAIEKELG